VRILRIVTRLNTGGPARHLTTLARALDADRYEQCSQPGGKARGPVRESSHTDAAGSHTDAAGGG